MELESLYTDQKRKSQATLQYIRDELMQIRTGSPNPAILEDIQVQAYSGQSTMRLVELATITKDSPNSLLISPFDPTVTHDIETAILKSPLNLSPQMRGKDIRVVFPPLNEEQREKYLRIVSQKIEEGKKSLRSIRDDVRKQILAFFEQKTITEDDKFRASKKIDEIAREAYDKLEEVKEKKRKDILSI